MSLCKFSYHKICLVKFHAAVLFLGGDSVTDGGTDGQRCSQYRYPLHFLTWSLAELCPFVNFTS